MNGWKPEKKRRRRYVVALTALAVVALFELSILGATKTTAAECGTYTDDIDKAMSAGLAISGTVVNTTAAGASHINVQSDYNIQDEMKAMQSANKDTQMSDFLSQLVSSALTSLVSDLMSKAKLSGVSMSSIIPNLSPGQISSAAGSASPYSDQALTWNSTATGFGVKDSAFTGAIRNSTPQ
jgi:hypothetical protein